MENEKVDRAMASVYNDEDDEQEEQKVEKFFSLIRGFQEARNNRRKDQVLEEEERKKKVKRLNDSQPSSSWVPSFEWEDFMTDEIQFRRPLPLVFPRPRNQKEDKKQQEEDDGLDLNLTL
ncbi:hypothetical protein P3X46_003330 [Hevea brasiliensis]|uniref:Protein NIM1-INTERACTING 1-like n=1 Tax=Hevea brasiliensis TaxID=3981 RepID=A0ABQ9N6S7_HEVBR|nr:protein NIM1-INTERACTING 1 [Hevea brasiliensis]KAJ9187919.1 hypothetical protein P3X46_003330 [Hevea brasiliensis]